MSVPVSYIQALTQRYQSLGYPPYRWFEANSAPPWQPLGKALADAHLGLLSTAGTYVVGQLAFHYKDDTSFRAIPLSTPDSDLRFAHVTENYLADARRDPGCVFPLDALRTLAFEGFIGSLPDSVLSCMGGIYSQRRVREELAPALLREFQSARVDAVVLVPLCPVCHQSVCLVARHFEENGIATLCFGAALDILRAGRPPRAVFTDYPLGHTMGRPFDRDDQLDILRTGLRALEKIDVPGEIRRLPNRWDASDEWKKTAGRTQGQDTRRPRDGTPQFQFDEDREAARASGVL